MEQEIQAQILGLNDYFVMTLDYVGTLAFAISGIRLASAKNFDLFGAFVVGLATAIGGGTVRDIMLGQPIFWMGQPIYFFITFFALLLVWLFQSHVVRRKNTWFLFDTFGLGMFAVIGIDKTLACGLPMWVAICMGTLTGAGGGVIRDVFLNEIPLIFRAEIYALACVIGGVVYWACRLMGVAPIPCGLMCCFAVIIMRLLAVKYHLHLPILKGDEHSNFPG